MKKAVIWLLTVLFVISCLPVMIVSASGTPGYTVESKTVRINDTFKLDVSIANNPGIISLRFKVIYDSNVLELISVEDTKLLNGYTTPSPRIASPYTLRWADSLATVNNTNQGVVARLTFKALSTATSTTVSIEHGEARNSAGSKVTFENGSGNITISDSCTHSQVTEVKENEVPTTCTAAGSYDKVVYCSICNEELSRQKITVPALGHAWGEWFDHPANAQKQIRFCSRCDATETRDKEPVIVDGIKIEKVGGYDVKLTGLDNSLAYVIRFATGEYANSSAVKKGTNAGFVQVSGKTEAVVTLPTHGLHTITAQVGSEQKFIGTVTIEQSDVENQFKASTNDLTVKVENLYGANQIRLIQNGAVVSKINMTTFTTDGLKTWAEFNAPAAGDYVVRIIYADGVTKEGNITVTVPSASISTNGRIFTLADYGANNVGYIRLAKGVITTASGMKSAPDLRTFGRKYFTDNTAAFAALDAVNGETTTYTVQIGYVSGYSEFLTFEITPTVPVISAKNGTVTLTNVQSDDYYIDWVRCAPGNLSSLFAVRHTKGSQVKKTTDIVNDTITFSGLSEGTYTLYYLYDGWNLSEGMVTVTVN